MDGEGAERRCMLTHACVVCLCPLGGSCSKTEDFRELWRKVRYVFDGGVLPSCKEESDATMVDLAGVTEEPPRYRIVRAGANVNSVEATLRKHGVCKAKAK
eukprot:2298544-Rhodomonas_salina.4